MMAQDNPFSAQQPPGYNYGTTTRTGTAATSSPPQTGNPFDPMASTARAPLPANMNPYGGGGPPAATYPASSYDAYGPGVSPPYGAPGTGGYNDPSVVPPQQQQQQQQQQQPGVHLPYGQTPGTTLAPPAGAGGYAQPSYDTNSAVVVSQYQSNPYAGLVSNYPDQQQQQPSNINYGGGVYTNDPYGQQQPYQHQPQEPWAGTSAAAANSYDPFRAPPAPPQPYPEQPVYSAPPPTYTPIPEPVYQQQFHAVQQAPYGDTDNPFGETTPAAPSAPETRTLGYDAPDEEAVPRMGNSRSQEYDDNSPDAKGEADPPDHHNNRFREELARTAPPGSSPLPKLHLVRKKGYVLSRISFRTIVMKKWKQSYWVQYGPHTMLWFRSESDFNDWLNNPYHDQAQRNFLIKLAVNFVHDLYKPNVRGYQVTQCRTKAYGNKMVRQFKLERWMDYGPTIAAAFGSYNPQEVDDLREALVECMRNTPLNSGIRATGAVRRQDQQQQQNEEEEDEDVSREDSSRRNEDNSASRQYESQNGGQMPPLGDNSVADEKDLLDVDNWDDVPSHAQGPYGQSPPHQQYGAPAYGVPPPPQQQQLYPPQQYPPQQQQGYPVAEPPQGPFGGPSPQQQQQMYPGYPPQQQPVAPAYHPPGY